MAFRRFIAATEFHLFLGCSTTISAVNYYAYRNKLTNLDALEADETVKRYAHAKSIESTIHSVGIMGLILAPNGHWKMTLAGSVVWFAACIFADNRTATARIRAGNQFTGAELRAWNLAVYSQ